MSSPSFANVFYTNSISNNRGYVHKNSVKIRGFSLKNLWRFMAVAIFALLTMSVAIIGRE